MISIVFDTETTGLPKPSCSDLSAQPKIIEIGIAIVGGGEIIEEYSQLINPGEEITEEITKITGITNDQLVGKPSFGEVYSELAELFRQAQELIAHNAQFDVQLLRFDLERIGKVNTFPWPPSVFCSMREYEAQFGYAPRLTDLYTHFTGEELKQTHRALDDVRALYTALESAGHWEGVGVVGSLF